MAPWRKARKVPRIIASADGQRSARLGEDDVVQLYSVA
jgi:hypothetical protein